MAIFSRLRRLVQNLPDDYKIKRESLPNELKRMGVKQEEINFSDILNLVGDVDYITRPDLIEAESMRPDMFTENYDSTAFSDISTSPYHPNYFARITGFKQDKGYESDHFPHHDNYLMHQRGYERPDAYVMDEFQSDLHQEGRRYGYDDGGIKAIDLDPEDLKNLEMAAVLGDTFEMERIRNLYDPENIQDIDTWYHSLHNKPVPRSPYEKTWLNKNIEQAMDTAGESGKPLMVPIKGELGDLHRSEGVQRWYEDRVEPTLKKTAKKNKWDYELVTEGDVDTQSINDKLSQAFLFNEGSKNVAIQEALEAGYPADLVARFLEIQTVPELMDVLSQVPDKLGGITYAKMTPKKGSNKDFELYSTGAAGLGAGYLAMGDEEKKQIIAMEPEEPFFDNTLPSSLEAIAAIGSGAALEPLAGLAGIAGAILPGPEGQGADWVKSVQDLAYMPDDPTTLMGIAKGLEDIINAYETGTDYLGDKTLEYTDSPALASIAKASPDILGGAFGIRQLMKKANIKLLEDPAR